ncbi:TIGR00725 family protein [bacterium]|nr:TIGR00725 family protein [candidate division CSSED10-310 bacterium]
MRSLNKRSVKRVAIIGAASADEGVLALAYRTGWLLGSRGVTVITGGKQGVMEAASRGAKEAGGLTVGILPGRDDRDANAYLDIAIPTGLGDARNAVIACAADTVIAIAGGYGTLSEIGLALKMGKTVIGIATWDLSKGIIAVTSPEEAVSKVFEI